MAKPVVGLVGWRGMVGSVLMQRMLEEQDFDLIEPVFFTTSNVGGQGPSVGKDIAPLKDAYNIEELKTLDVILTCQGGDYTNEVFPKLREAGWNGYWIDAASSLRMADDSVIVLDPVNRKVIDQSLDAGTKIQCSEFSHVDQASWCAGGTPQTRREPGTPRRLFKQGLPSWRPGMGFRLGQCSNHRTFAPNWFPSAHPPEQRAQGSGDAPACASFHLH